MESYTIETIVHQPPVLMHHDRVENDANIRAIEIHLPTQSVGNITTIERYISDSYVETSYKILQNGHQMFTHTEKNNGKTLIIMTFVVNGLLMVCFNNEIAMPYQTVMAISCMQTKKRGRMIDIVCDTDPLKNHIGKEYSFTISNCSITLLSEALYHIEKTMNA